MGRLRAFVSQVERPAGRLHGTTGSRHVHTDDELHRLRDLVNGRPSPYVMFNNLPRTSDAERFLALLSGQVGPLRRRRAH